MARDPREQAQRYTNAKTARNQHENDWKMAAAFCLPSQYSGWQVEGITPLFNNSNSQVRRMIYDSTGTRSLPKYMAILERLATPTGSKWHKLSASDPRLMKSRRVKEYFDNVTELLFKMRYMARANFRAASNEMYAQLGAYGNGPIYVARRRPNALFRSPSLLYRSLKLNDIFVFVNDNGEVDTVFQRFFLNVRQFRQQFPNTGTPPSMASEALKPVPDDNRYFEFVRIIEPRDEKDYDPQALDARRHPIYSCVLMPTDKVIVGEEEGYRSMPILFPRTFSMSGDPYGTGPAVAALASLGGASQIKKTNLKQGNMAGEPVILAADDGALNGVVDLKPGHINYGGINKEGRRLIDILPTGNYQINQDLLADERSDIEDSFFVTLFQILTDTPEMTATEVMERVAEKAALLSPTMGRLQSEWLGPCVDREIDVLDEMGMMPEMPPELVEARGEYSMTYTSPLAKGEYAEEISGFARSLELAINIINATQDPSPLDHFDFDTALPEIADKWSVPVRWMSSEEDIAAKRGSRSQQMQQDAMMKNAPALASAAKTAADMQNGGA